MNYPKDCADSEIKCRGWQQCTGTTESMYTTWILVPNSYKIHEDSPLLCIPRVSTKEMLRSCCADDGFFWFCVDDNLWKTLYYPTKGLPMYLFLRKNILTIRMIYCLIGLYYVHTTKLIKWFRNSVKGLNFDMNAYVHGHIEDLCISFSLYQHLKTSLVDGVYFCSMFSFTSVLVPDYCFCLDVIQILIKTLGRGYNLYLSK